MDSGIRLRSLILTFASALFATLIIVFTNDLTTYWPLYGLPILIAALTYHISGAVVAAAALPALTLVLHLEMGGTTGSLPRDLTVGMAVLAGIGLVVGARARAWEARCAELAACAVTDTLTGVYTHDCFLARLEEEIARAGRYEVPVAVAIATVDEMQQFRDTFGHHRGDLLLAHLARLLENTVRNTDVLARFQDGYGIIFPFTDAHTAERVVERVLASVAETEFEGDELQPVTRHTVSVGVSAYPEPAGDRSGLLDSAVAGLKWCQEQGGNRVRRQAATSQEPQDAVRSNRLGEVAP